MKEISQNHATNEIKLTFLLIIHSIKHSQQSRM